MIQAEENAKTFVSVGLIASGILSTSIPREVLYCSTGVPVAYTHNGINYRLESAIGSCLKYTKTSNMSMPNISATTAGSTSKGISKLPYKKLRNVN